VRWLPALVLAALAVLPAPATARDIITIERYRNGTRILLDRDSIKPVEDGRTHLREALVSIDNSRNPLALAEFAAADVRVRVDCASGEIAVLWSRGYAGDGAFIAAAPTPYPHGMRRPVNAFETLVRDKVCAMR